MLKKILLLSLAVCAVFLSGENYVLAQKVKPTAIYKTPSRIFLNGDENGGDENTSDKLLLETFYPIGWSKDGKFAYYTEPADEACGCYFASLIIQDMQTDKVVWSYTNVNQDFGDNPPEETIESFWKKHQKEFSRRLAQFRIVAGSDFKLLNSPLETANDSIKIDFFSDVQLTEDFYNSKGNVILKLISNKKGAKTVYRKSYSGTGSAGIINISIGGVLLSPFEPRTAIVLVETHRGWEGPPNVTQINPVGANLMTGFR